MSAIANEAKPIATITWCYDCRAEVRGIVTSDWRVIRGVDRCPRCAAFDATRTPEQIRSIVIPPYDELKLRERLFAAQKETQP